MRRWRERYQEHGYDGLYDYRKRQPSPKRIPLKTLETVLQLYREKYFDFNVRHFHEKLTEEHGITISYTWVKMALQGAGLRILRAVGQLSSLTSYLEQVRRIWFCALRRRSQRRMTWGAFGQLLERFPLPTPRITHPCAT